MVRSTIYYVSAMSTMFKNANFGDLLGLPEWGSREVNKRNPPKHTPASLHRHLGGQSLIFAFPEGSPFGTKILEDGALADMPRPLLCQSGLMTAQGAKNTAKWFPNSMFFYMSLLHCICRAVPGTSLLKLKLAVYHTSRQYYSDKRHTHHADPP